MAKVVREPIQVYLTPDERAELDRAAEAMGVSRSEVLRRGVRAVRPQRYAGALRGLVDEGSVTPPTAAGPEPPPSRPIAPLGSLLAELAEARSER